MRFAKISRTLLPLALPIVFAVCATAQDHPNVSPNMVRDQLMQQPAGASTPQAAPPATASSPSEPIKNTSKAATKAKPHTKATPDAAKTSAVAAPGAKPAPVKPKAAGESAAKPDSEKAEKTPAEKPAGDKAAASKRDPFDALLNKAQANNGPTENLPPGKAGLLVGSLKIDGIVNGKGGMIAIVSNPQQRVYFLREGDKLYDGAVEHITLEAISFNETGKDAFGKPLERQVTKRLYPSPGDQQ
jgi:Tfp pilus assembly protein PilP